MRILVVEDDKTIGDGLVTGLTMEGHAPDWVEERESAETALESTSYDMVILDIGLPDGSGFDVLSSLRKGRKDTPVLILTAYDDLSYKVRGLDMGADDYLIKPFRLEELLARLRALRRRAKGRASSVLKIGDVTLDPAAHKVARDGKDIKLGSREFAVLQALMEHAGKIITRSQIEDSLYGWNAEIESNAIEVHIHGLRRKLGKAFIETIRHVGYRVGGE